MGASIAHELAGIRDAASCRDWLTSLDLPPAERAELIEQLFAVLEKADGPSQDGFDVLEQVRPFHLRAIDGQLRELADNAFPLPAPAWQRLHHCMQSMQRARDLYRRVDFDAQVTVIDAPSGPMRRVRERAAQTLAAVLPLMRALDYQSRRVHALLLFQVCVEPQEWTLLADLAAQARASTFLDSPLPDDFPVAKGASARTLFIAPLLMRAARMDAHDTYERALIDRMARHWAGRVGFRIDEGAQLQDSRNGPTMVLDASLAVRLDTQSLLRRLEDRKQMLESGTGIPRGLPRGMGRSKAVALLGQLGELWGATVRPPAPGIPVNVPAAMHPGLPDFEAPAAASSCAGAAAMAYDYGRYEQDTLIRRSSDLRRGTPDLLAKTHARLFEGAETVDWLSRNGDEARIERLGARALVYRSLVALHPRRPNPPPQVALYERQAIWLGCVRAMEQFDRPDRAGRRPQRLAVQLWPRPAVLAALRLNQSAVFAPVYYLPPVGGLGASVFLPPGCWRAMSQASLRLPGEETTVMLEHAIEQGPGFERVLLSGFTVE